MGTESFEKQVKERINEEKKRLIKQEKALDLYIKLKTIRHNGLPATDRVVIAVQRKKYSQWVNVSEVELSAPGEQTSKIHIDLLDQQIAEAKKICENLGVTDL